MSRGNYKPFEAGDIDTSLTRVVLHEPATYLMFPFIDGRGSEPRFASISVVIKGDAATREDLAILAERVKAAAQDARWFLNFNTPWLLNPSRVDTPGAAAGRRPAR